MGFTPADIEALIKLSLAAFYGALIGLEREVQGKEAGFRTHALVTMGSCLIMLVSMQLFRMYQGIADVDPSRIAAQVVSGIGFLGAGTIIRSRTSVRGLTTAASVWTASGIGLAVGAGMYVAALIATGIVVSLLILFGHLVAHFTKDVGEDKDR